MPEGHSIHRLARQFERNFVGQILFVSSPQGRFSSSAKRVDGCRLVAVQAAGKHLFLMFEHELIIHVHLGIYGAWDFFGDILVHESFEIPPYVEQTLEDHPGGSAMPGLHDHGTEASIYSIGAPRKTRKTGQSYDRFPPEPRGQVRLRILADAVGADLGGPAICELISAVQMDDIIRRLGPDPLITPRDEALNRLGRLFAKRSVPVAQLLMDQHVLAGIGNIYRAEILFRTRLHPYIPGRDLSMQTIERLWDDWSLLLEIGVKTGHMMTREGVGIDWEQRYWVYQRAGNPCHICGTSIAVALLSCRKLFWCPQDQAHNS